MGKIFCSTKRFLPLRQGEIVTNLIRFAARSYKLTEGATYDLNFSSIEHPFSIIMSQDCDLDQDYNARFGADDQPKEQNKISSLLFCDMIEAAALRPRFNSDEWSKVKSNQVIRYQFIEEVPRCSDNKRKGLPELTADFKQYYSVPTEYFYWLVTQGIAQRRTKLRSPYMEHFVQRFMTFHLRIALPEQHRSISAAFQPSLPSP